MTLRSPLGWPIDLCDWSSAMHEAGQAATHHALLNHTADIDATTAHAEIYYLFAACNRDESNWMAGGR